MSEPSAIQEPRAVTVHLYVGTSRQGMPLTLAVVSDGFRYYYLEAGGRVPQFQVAPRIMLVQLNDAERMTDTDQPEIVIERAGLPDVRLHRLHDHYVVASDGKTFLGGYRTPRRPELGLRYVLFGRQSGQCWRFEAATGQLRSIYMVTDATDTSVTYREPEGVQHKTFRFVMDCRKRTFVIPTSISPGYAARFAKRLRLER